MPSAEELLAEAQAQHDLEWGTYRAAGPINLDGVRAFNEGDAVPVSHVTRGLVDESEVVKVSDAAPAVSAASAVPADPNIQAVPATNPEVV
jgi:hypothetical protein